LLRTASIDDPFVHTLPCCDLYVDESRVNFPDFPMAGRGSVLVYYARADCGGGCEIRAVYRVVGRRAIKLFDAENPSFLAVNRKRIAVAWSKSRRVELRTLGGSVVSAFELDRRPTAIALSRERLAVLMTGGRVELFSATSGSSEGARTVPWRVGPMLAASGRWLVYAVGRIITSVDLETGQSHVLAHAANRPRDLTISGRRVSWREYVADQGSRILVAVLPVG
jgi:hypothetical protein